jgi:hypothetical protein
LVGQRQERTPHNNRKFVHVSYIVTFTL